MAGGIVPNPIPLNPQGWDQQAIRRGARTYGAVEQDPESPIEGWLWIRRDLSPPEIRVKLQDVVYATTMTAT